MATDEQTAGLTVKKSDDLSEWYSQVVIKSKLADYSKVSGCMVFRPNSYELWELVQQKFNAAIKKTGHRNCYFPLLIPEALLTKEKNHVEGFSPEVAWVTHGGDSKLNERLAVRPTSETIMYDSYAKWIRSWRDLPLLLNQWNSVVRWEFKHAKPFLRTREFLWQEGHTVHATYDDAEHEVLQQLEEYRKLVEEDMAVAVVKGKKSTMEKFAGADYSTTIEGVMPDGKALQMGTSHLLGQNFAKAFDITFKDKDEKDKHPVQTSWGLSTRTIGALIMVHGDDKGVIIPPRVAPIQAVIVPIIFKNKEDLVNTHVQKVKDILGDSIRLYHDNRDEQSSGWKFNDWELQGVPVRIEIGPKDAEKNQVVLVKRNSGEKVFVSADTLVQDLQNTLNEVQQELYGASKAHLDASIVDVQTLDELKAAIEDKKLARCHFIDNVEQEEKIKEATGACTRCFPFDAQGKKGTCIATGVETDTVAIFGKSY